MRPQVDKRFHAKSIFVRRIDCIVCGISNRVLHFRFFNIFFSVRDETEQVADIFLKVGPYLKMYSTYIRQFDKNVALLEEQSRKNSPFAAVLREFEVTATRFFVFFVVVFFRVCLFPSPTRSLPQASPRCANLALKHYLLKPVQRIPQYQLLLRGKTCRAAWRLAPCPPPPHPPLWR